MKLFPTKLFSTPCLIPLALTAGLALAPHAARAQVAGLTFTFAPAVQTVGIGGSADYTGQFINATNTDYFVTLGDYSPDALGGSPLVTGFSGVDLNNPFEVLAGQTFTFTGVETLSADPALGSGTYTGLVDFQGRTAADYLAGTGSDTTLSIAPITLIIDGGTVPAVPEASTTISLGLLLLLGGAGVWQARRRGAAAL